MEFHLSYYTLRHSPMPHEDCRKYHLREGRRSLRRYSRLPLNLSNSQTSEFIYEAQISFLVSGFDDWFWTSYCFVDTFPISEDSPTSYRDRGVDAAGGGERYVEFPVWNPREYFLYVLSRRFRQVTKEWSILVDTLDSRLDVYVS